MAAAQTPSTFLGQGWAFPVGIEAGQTATAAYDEDVRQAILIIVGTNPGERVMRPDFGAGLNAFVFEPLNPATLEAIRQRVMEDVRSRDSERLAIEMTSGIDVARDLLFSNARRGPIGRD